MSRSFSFSFFKKKPKCKQCFSKKTRKVTISGICQQSHETSTYTEENCFALIYNDDKVQQFNLRSEPLFREHINESKVEDLMTLQCKPFLKPHPQCMPCITLDSLHLKNEGIETAKASIFSIRLLQKIFHFISFHIHHSS